MSRFCLPDAERLENFVRFMARNLYYEITPRSRPPPLGYRCVGYTTKCSRVLFSHAQTTRHTQKSFSSGAGWLVCRSLLLLFLRNQIILVKCSAHKHSDLVNAAHANKRTVYKMIDVHGVLGMYAVVCWIEEDKKQGSVLWL